MARGGSRSPRPPRRMKDDASSRDCARRGRVAGPAVRGRTSRAPVFRGGVTLVPVDVTVLDHDEKPVPGLTAADFEVKLDGHLQPVRTVAYEEVALPSAATRAGTPAAAPPREATNTAPPAEPRLFVIMLDDLSITPARGKGMFFAAAHFVDTLPISDVVGFDVERRGHAQPHAESPSGGRSPPARRRRVQRSPRPDARVRGGACGGARSTERGRDHASANHSARLFRRKDGDPSRDRGGSSSCAEQVTRKARMVGRTCPIKRPPTKSGRT